MGEGYEQSKGKIDVNRCFESGTPENGAIPLDTKRLAYWDISKNDWQVERDSIEVRVGASSADIRMKQQLKME